MFYIETAYAQQILSKLNLRSLNRSLYNSLLNKDFLQGHD